MNRIQQKFQELRQNRQKALIPFITAGDPSLAMTEELVHAFEQKGADIIELGVPFSDPLADGPTIQAASQRALKNGVTLPKILDTVARIRQKSQVPVCLMTYYNPIFHYGEEKFVKAARAKGVDGLIIPDLPPEEAGVLVKAARAQEIATIFFVAPTTSPARMKKVLKASTGFVYFVSVAGVTGARDGVPSSVRQKVKQAQKLTQKPICVGFGISTPKQVQRIASFADGVIVGSAIINEIVKRAHQKNCVPAVARYVAKLRQGL
jgi:tryptophan synthase alpha chain